MRRKTWIVLLSLGAVLGFTLGIARLTGHLGHGRYGHGWHARHAALEERAADACVRAAERVLRERAAAAVSPKAP